MSAGVSRPGRSLVPAPVPARLLVPALVPAPLLVPALVPAPVLVPAPASSAADGRAATPRSGDARPYEAATRSSSAGPSASPPGSGPAAGPVGPRPTAPLHPSSLSVSSIN